MLWNKEPAIILGAINAIIAVGVGFGLPLTPAQVGLINAAVAAILALVTRSQVVSTAQNDKLIATAISLPTNTPVEVVKTIQAEKDSK